MRLHYSQHATATYQALLALEASLKLDNPLKDLIKIRASQINGCVFCVDMHVKEAKLHGERELRLYHLPVWRESALFNGKERAAPSPAWLTTMSAMPTTLPCAPISTKKNWSHSPTSSTPGTASTPPSPPLPGGWITSWGWTRQD